MTHGFLGMTQRRFYQLEKRRLAPHIQLWGTAVDETRGARGGFYLAGQGYSGEDCADVIEWIFERANGYPRRPIFWKDATSRPSDMEGATWAPRGICSGHQL